MPSFPFLKSFAARVVVVALAQDMRCHFRVCMTCHDCFYERVVGSLQEKKSSLLLNISQDGDLHNAGHSTCHNWFYPQFLRAQACKSQVWLLLWPWFNCKKRRSDCYIHLSDGDISHMSHICEMRKPFCVQISFIQHFDKLTKHSSSSIESV